MDETPVLAGQSPAPAPAPAAAPPVAVASFDGHSKVLLHLCLKNALLNLVTLFIYRFWGKTHLRRYYWGNARFCGDYLEYTGTGGELCKGFFIAAVVITVILAATTALGFAAQAAGITGVMPLVDLLQIAVFSCLWFVAIHRAWRYRLSRTRFRGVGMHLDGRTRDFLWVAIKSGVLAALTFGIAQPVMAVQLSGAIIGNTRLGQSRFSLVDAHGSDLIDDWMRHLLVVLAGVVVTVVAATQLAAAGLVAGVLAVLLAFASWVRYRVTLLRYLVNRLAFGEARFTCSFSVRASTGIIARYVATLAVLPASLALGLALTVFAGNLSLDSAELEEVLPSLATGGMLIGAAFVLLVHPILKTMQLDLPLARHILATLSVTHPEAFAQAVQDPAAKELRQGEGLADLFGIDGI